MITNTFRANAKTLLATLALFVFIGAYGIAEASHTWGPYHWARTANPFTIKLGDNVSSAWDAYLITSANDWSLSNVLDVTVVAGQSGKNCRATLGRGEVCSAKYGRNGWLGIASIWVNGEHITQGTVKMNDTYFITSTYNKPAWKNLVMCQEAGHIFGLDHQDENFSNTPLGTCMDYSNDPTLNQHPNAHDYEMLETIYAHLDSSTTLSATSLSGAARQDIEDPNDPKEWGKEIRRSKDGRASLYVRDYGNEQKKFTHVFWAE